MHSHILTVSQLTAQIKGLLEGAFSDVWVEGEISNLSAPHSGHLYFTLKDERAQIKAVLFRSSQRFLKFTLQHGITVICRGRAGVYEPRGEYQLILDYIEPKGVGALQLAFEQLKARLEQEGLFAPERKRPLPLLPRRVGIITSPTGAAIRDMLRVIRRRHPRMHVLLYPVPVQGSEAAPAIAEALRYFNGTGSADVLIVGRGGGSLEDLWAFNDESLARAIRASRLPVISAVGHETDFTIADFVADLRAPTPSAAAEMVVETEAALRRRIGDLAARQTRTLRHSLSLLRASIRAHERLLGDPRRLLEHFGQRVDDRTHRLAQQARHLLRRDRVRLAAAAAGLGHLNPLETLARGYSITLTAAGSVVKDAEDVRPGDLLRTKLAQGELLSRVEEAAAGFRRNCS